MNTKMINFRNSLADTFTDIVRSDVYNLFARCIDFSKVRLGSYTSRALASMTVTGDCVGCSHLIFHKSSHNLYAVLALQAPVAGGAFTFDFEGEISEDSSRSGDWTFKYEGIANRKLYVPDADSYLPPFKFFSTVPAYLGMEFGGSMAYDPDYCKERLGIPCVTTDCDENLLLEHPPVDCTCFDGCALNQVCVPLKHTMGRSEALDFVRDLAQYECYAPIIDSWDKFPYIPLETRILWYTTFGIMHSTSTLIHDLMVDHDRKDMTPLEILRQISSTAIRAASRYTRIFVPTVGTGRYELFDFSAHLENFLKVLDADEMRYLG